MEAVDAKDLSQFLGELQTETDRGLPLVAAALRLCYEIFNSANAKPQWMAEFMVRATTMCGTQRSAVSWSAAR